MTLKQRFEVFKRDRFQCQYCGKSPPEVTLEIDHIKAKSEGGSNNINNLITACFDCNRGKKNIPLNLLPNTISTNFKILKEKELQLKEYNKFVAKIERRSQKDIREISKIYNSYFNEYEFSERFKNVSLKRFLKLLPKNKIIEAIHLSCIKFQNKSYGADESIRYFCGICWNRIKGTNYYAED